MAAEEPRVDCIAATVRRFGNRMEKKRHASISPPPAKRRRSDSGEPKIPQTKHPSHASDVGASTGVPLRMFSWNINGIAPFLQPSIATLFTPKKKIAQSAGTAAPTSLRQVLRRHDWPHVFFLQEVKMHPEDQSIKRSVERAVNKTLDSQDDGPTYSVRFSLPRDKFNARGFGRKVYGVASIIRDDYMATQVLKVREVGWDLEGRVSVIETNDKLAIFNIYAVNGTDNPYKDPETGVVKGTRHDRKHAFHRQLVKEGQQLEAKGYRLVLAGDLNVAPAPIDGHPNLRTKPYQHVKNREDFHNRFLRDTPSDSEVGLGLIDSFRHLHPENKKYSWISRTRGWLSSCDRVDHILVSRSLVDAGRLQQAEVYMTQADRGPSDHVPISITLDMCEKNT